MLTRLIIITTLSAILAMVASQCRAAERRIVLNNFVNIAVLAFVLLQALQFVSTTELPIRAVGFMKNPNMAGFVLLTLSALLVYTKQDFQQAFIAFGIYFSSPRSFVICFIVYTMLIGFKKMKWFWGTLLFICVLTQTPGASTGSKVASDRIFLTPVVLAEYLGAGRIVKEWYQHFVIGGDTTRLLFSENGHVNIDERMDSGLSDNAYFSYLHLMGGWFWLWLSVVLLPFIFGTGYQLKAYYAAALLSGLTMQIFILNPSWEILAVVYGLSLSERGKCQAF